MTARAPFGGLTLVADTSAWLRAAHPSVRESWVAALRAEQIVTTAPVMLEMLFSAPDAAAFEELESELAMLRELPVTRSVTRAAITALRELAVIGPGYHRLPVPDTLIAAAAQDVGLGVLHYDRHFDRLAQVLAFESVWIAPPGSL